MSTTELFEGNQLSEVSRRSFLGLGALAAVGSVAAAAVAPKIAEAAETDSDKVGEDGQAVVKVWDGIQLSKGHIIHDPSLCCGCKQCEITCSISHWGVMNELYSGIRIKTDLLGGYISEAFVCKQCAGPECVAVCPTGALHVDKETGARVIDKDVCIGCQLCLNACPVAPSRIRYVDTENVCFKCDLCGGDPKCVKQCPTVALSCSWISAAADPTIVHTDSGITVQYVLTGAVLALSKDYVILDEVDAIIGNGGVTVKADLTSMYTQPFTAKVKCSYFSQSGETLNFSERLSYDLGTYDTVNIVDFFETAHPEEVASVRMEIMCGKIAG